MALTLAEMRDKVAVNAKVQGGALDDVILDFLNRVYYLIARQRRNPNLLLFTDVVGTLASSQGAPVNLPADFLIEDRLVWIGAGTNIINRLLPKTDELVIPLSDEDAPTQYTINANVSTETPFQLFVYPYELYQEETFVRLWYYKFPARLAAEDSIPFDNFEEEMMIKAEAMVHIYFGKLEQAKMTMMELGSGNQELPAQ